MSIAADKKVIFVKSGYVKAILFPGEVGAVSYGDAIEIDGTVEVGVGDQWPAPEPKAAPTKAAKAKATKAADTQAAADPTPAAASAEAPAPSGSLLKPEAAA